MIPKIIHQIWIGNLNAPLNMMKTWKEKHPHFEYIHWSEKEIEKRNMKLECQHRIDEMEEINGKADIIRWEILYKYGGVFIDADSICIEPIDYLLKNYQSFAGWEQEEVRNGLIATGTMGFPPKHPLIRSIIDWIKTNCVNVKKTGKRAWITVGPGLLTKMYNLGKYNMKILPSYTFLPIHCTGLEYKGHGKIYAYQEWSSTKQNYEIINSIKLPLQFTQSIINENVSVLIPIYNTPVKYLKECFDSIMHQEGNFFMEIVIVDDGSDDIYSKLLEKTIEIYKNCSRFCKWNLYKSDKNEGVSASLQYGLEKCSYNIVVRMDSDDIMTPKRIQTQLKFMKDNKDCVVCGSQINMFEQQGLNRINKGNTNHLTITLDDFMNTRNEWFVNHPTVIFKRDAILSVGGYVKNLKGLPEDFHLWLRILKKYKIIHNINEVLLYYRIHSDQQSSYIIKKQNNWEDIKSKWISEILQ